MECANYVVLKETTPSTFLSDQVCVCFIALIIEPLHDKTNKMTCAPSKDSDQPGHAPSLIKVFAVCMKKHWALNYLLSAQ